MFPAFKPHQSRSHSLTLFWTHQSTTPLLKTQDQKNKNTLNIFKSYTAKLSIPVCSNISDVHVICEGETEKEVEIKLFVFSTQNITEKDAETLRVTLCLNK